ncbi:MAG: AraC family transcriptional regulator [Ruminococcaceae bacterium]|nr:AraC family transcriptional regulator [Oscillospiraceae bacterium]
MEKANIFVSELSSSRHCFSKYHFCRGNNNKRKTRIGIILKGSGTYIYLNKKLNVTEGDVVFIPENIYCYSEWNGDPEIEVVYVSCFIHYDSFAYEPQIILCDESVKSDLIRISELLELGYIDGLEAYSLFYNILRQIFPQMIRSDLVLDKTLQTAMEYITSNWNNNFSVSDLAKKCCVSESTLYHLFQKELGQTPIRFINSIRINIAMEYLENTNYSISTISRMVCFNSENHFRKTFSDVVGTTPLKFRKNRNTVAKG